MAPESISKNVVPPRRFEFKTMTVTPFNVSGAPKSPKVMICSLLQFVNVPVTFRTTEVEDRNTPHPATVMLDRTKLYTTFASVLIV